MKLFLLILVFLKILPLVVFASDLNSSKTENVTQHVIRVLEPGIFDYQSKEFIIRMRAWGVNFPTRGKPGYQNAIAFTERVLLTAKLVITVKETFDKANLKVVDLKTSPNGESFSRLAIENGLGWHDEKESNRYGPFVIAQLKAKRNKAGLWSSGYNLQPMNELVAPRPNLPGIYTQNPNSLLPQIRYWITSLGKVHRPGCSFYQRGRGTLSSTPKGFDCRICGGRDGK